MGMWLKFVMGCLMLERWREMQGLSWLLVELKWIEVLDRTELLNYVSIVGLLKKIHRRDLKFGWQTQLDEDDGYLIAFEGVCDDGILYEWLGLDA